MSFVLDSSVTIAWFLPDEYSAPTLRLLERGGEDETLQVAERFRLTLYDACYLELAQRRNLPLASLDRQLSDAAKAMS